MLGKLFSLQGRLKQREARLVLSGLRDEVRDVLRWTRLDRFLEIEEG
jgi:anti-anti-sigma regulatory factor